MRRDQAAFLLASVTAVLGTFFLHRGRAPAPLAPVTVAVASDLHYIAPSLTDGGAYFRYITENGDGKYMSSCEEITEAFIARILADPPDVLILAGDLTFNGAAESHRALAEKLLRLQRAGIPVLVLPGNHDLENPMAASFHGERFTSVPGVTASEFEELYRDFGPGQALSRDAASLSYTAQITPDLRVLLLDVNTTESPGALRKETLLWARRQLEEARRQGVRILAVSHQNVLPHNSLIQEGFMIEGSERILPLYERFGVICGLSGHMHLQHIARSAAGFPEIAVSSLVTAPNQYGVLTLAGNRADYRTERVEGPFSREAERFFRDNAYRQAAGELEGNPERERLSAFFAEVSAAYFAGRCDALSWDEALYQAWQDRRSALSFYLRSIRDDGLRNHTETDFTFS